MHSHHHPTTGKRLQLSLLATLLFVVVEFIAGLQAHSLALLSDAGHNFTDALSLLLAWFAFFVEAKPPSETKTYGYQRAGVLAAFVNALALALLAGFIFYESYRRLGNPQEVSERIMIWVAFAGLAVNLGVMFGLRAASRSDINIRSAFVHMLGDAVSSAGIIIGGFIIAWTGYHWIDPLLSIFIGLLILWTAWDIIKESLNILLEGLPRNLRLETVIGAMRGVPGVIDVHDVHIWSLGSASHALSSHVMIEDLPPSSSESTLRSINEVLEARFHITHTTIQFEHALCPISENGCAVVPHEHEHAEHEHR
ncbi:MAG TPA: cation diffusion facilitator family transporter [Bryobacterales bacterium]|nr:cation diffusion facilitator family transporter [Bryobacterales bacterium]